MKIEIHILNKDFARLVRQPYEGFVQTGYRYLWLLCSAMVNLTRFNERQPRGYEEMQKIGISFIISTTSITPEAGIQVLKDLLFHSDTTTYLFRVIDIRNYKEFLSSGNSRHDKNISRLERAELEALDQSADETMYAAKELYKAWEYTRKKNPIILVRYKQASFERIKGTSSQYLWKIKKGQSFKDAVDAHVIIWFD